MVQLDGVKNTEHYNKWTKIRNHIRELPYGTYQEPAPASEVSPTYSSTLVPYESYPFSKSGNSMQPSLVTHSQSNLPPIDYHDEKEGSKVVPHYQCKVVMKGMDVRVKAVVDGNNNLMQVVCTTVHVDGDFSVNKQVCA